MKLMHFSKETERFEPDAEFETFDKNAGCYFYEVPEYSEDFQRLEDGWNDRVAWFFEIDDNYIEEAEETGGETEFFVKAINFDNLIEISKPRMKADWE